MDNEQIWGLKRTRSTEVLNVLQWLEAELTAFCCALQIAAVPFLPLLEQLTFNQRVTGSIPVAPTNDFNSLQTKFFK